MEHAGVQALLLQAPCISCYIDPLKHPDGAAGLSHLGPTCAGVIDPLSHAELPSSSSSSIADEATMAAAAAAAAWCGAYALALALPAPADACTSEGSMQC